MAQTNLRHFFCNRDRGEMGFFYSLNVAEERFQLVHHRAGLAGRLCAMHCHSRRDPAQPDADPVAALDGLLQSVGCAAVPSFVPDPFFKTGPFAWNGMFSFWIPGTLFFAWYVVMLVTISKAIDRDALRNAGS